MREQEAKKKYIQELSSVILLYIAVLFGAVSAGKYLAPGIGRTILLLTPMIPVTIGIWVIQRQFRRMDEYVRLRTLESVALSAAVTAGWTLTYGFLEMAGFPKLSMFTVWPVMGFSWGAIACANRLTAR